MDMVRLDAGAIPIALEPVRCREVAREAVEILTPAAEAKGQQLHLASTDDVIVVGNHARARQVLVNLIGNAVKFTPDGGSITVSVARGGSCDGTWGEIRVTDTGPGIPEAERAAIFEPYYRSETTRSLPGIGLGLAISHALVAQMGGTLELESEAGAGASFAVRLPEYIAELPLPAS
jgi:signal transduction histidine kinase